MNELEYEVLGKKYREIWVTSDLHFGHKNVLKFCPTTRPWRDVDEMNFKLKESWNNQVQENDLVIVVGDFSFMNEVDTVYTLQTLKGSKALIVGNHDMKMMDRFNFRKEFIFTRDLVSLVIKGQKYVFCHFPIYEWDSMQRGSMHIHGHCHGNRPINSVGGRIIDAGWDAQGRLLKLSEIKDFLIDKEIRTH